MEELLKNINKKYTDLGERPEAYLKGLYHAKPITYWDYIEVETLLSLQKPRTDFKDEKIFILYHQVTELVLKLIYHEIEQVVEHPNPEESFLIEKLKRVNRYTEMLITSFDIMKDGMSLDDYNQY
ncbi:MAG: tryptophan 2,3-dioxygenase family protein, partial [Flavobacteriaceae bacterium]|nr:tryptophan 2,3-dioxygenase family protein [Flavobacteriaceae bacterium]